MIEISGLGFRYGNREALRDFHLTVRQGEVMGLLGPNGSGKSTLLGILATLLPVAPGTVRIDGLDPARDGDGIRRRLGVAFQTPSLDGKLTVAENLRFHGYLFGLRGRELTRRMDGMLERFGLSDRSGERVETLSGGLRRRAELAKTLLHNPSLLLLDEPSSGLDPAARLEFWGALGDLCRGGNLTVLVATHLMDEADRCGRVALMDQGKLVVVDSPDALKGQMEGDILTLETADPEGLARDIRSRHGLAAEVLAGTVRVTHGPGLGSLPGLLRDYENRIVALHMGKPTLEDVFLARTGHRIHEGGE